MDKNNITGSHNEKNAVKDTTAPNDHKDMPVKTPATDTNKNTAEDEGLNHTTTNGNEIQPGTTPPGDE